MTLKDDLEQVSKPNRGTTRYFGFQRRVEKMNSARLRLEYVVVGTCKT
jgi:hypothetical protein